MQKETLIGLFSLNIEKLRSQETVSQFDFGKKNTNDEEIKSLGLYDATRPTRFSNIRHLADKQGKFSLS